MKIVISHVYSEKNKGDAALLSVLLSHARKEFIGARITVLCFDAISDETLGDARMGYGFMHIAHGTFRDPLLKLIFSGWLISYLTLWAIVRRIFKIRLWLPRKIRETVQIYDSADLIIPVGGGYLRSRAGVKETMVLVFQVFPFIFSAILGKISVGYSQSVGPFGSKLQEKIAEFGVKRLDGIIAREKITEALLRDWGLSEEVHLSSDSGFAFTTLNEFDLRQHIGIESGKMLVGMTVRDWMKSAAQEEYEKTMGEFCDRLVERYDAEIVFLPQVTVETHKDDDRICAKKVYGFVRHKAAVHLLEEHMNLHELKAAYGCLDYLVGTRFHSVIFALTSGVPSIAIGYEHKTHGIMADLGLSGWVADIAKTYPEELSSLFDKLVENRESYLKKLSAIMPHYAEKAGGSIVFVRKLYEKRKNA